MLGITLVLGVISIVAVYSASRVAMGAGADIRAAVFTRVQVFSAREMNRFGTPSLITRNTNDIQQVQVFLQAALTLMVIAPIMSVGGVIMAIKESAALSPLMAVSVPLMAALVGAVSVVVMPKFRTMQVRIDRINQVLREQITGVRVIRAFVRTGAEADRFGDANTDLTATALRINRIFALVFPSVMAIMNLSSVAVIWFGGHLVRDGSMPIGNLTAFLTYIMQILIAVMMAVMLMILLPRAAASAERIEQVLDTTPSISDPPQPVRPAAATGLVQFQDVTFGYPGSELPVLHDLAFSLRPGETSAIIGGTGSGKTTLLNLIPRFFDASEGRVLVNGVDVREQEQEQLWSSIGLVPQASFLFSGSVASNLRLGRPEATEEELWRALEVAQARDFVAAMPGQLGATIDQGGSNVSGGQRQRLSIARALLKNAPILILDEATSQLDTESELLVQQALGNLMTNRTVIVIAHRLSTIRRANQILVVEDGRILERGNHAELYALNGRYRDLYDRQHGLEQNLFLAPGEGDVVPEAGGNGGRAAPAPGVLDLMQGRGR